VKQTFRVRLCLAAALAAILAATARPAERAPGKTLTSILLVARGAVSDPNFGGSIVVVMNNLGPAPIGVIINRPMPLAVGRLLPKLERLAQVHDKVYYGGPVEFPEMWFLFRAKTAPAHAIRVCAGVYVSGDRRLLLRLLARRNPMQGLRIFLGHAGWAPGQLEAEIHGGAWTLHPADAASIFAPKPLRPWPSPHGPRRGT
jgi:putative transcriptional regulator